MQTPLSLFYPHPPQPSPAPAPQADAERRAEIRAVGQSIEPPAGWRLEAHRPARREAVDAATQVGVLLAAPAWC